MSKRFACAIHILFVALTLLTVGSDRAGAQAAPGTPVSESEEKARAHFRLGRAYYDNGDFAQAAVEFEAAYASSQRAALLYNIYLAYRDANDLRHAAEALRKYLELEHNIENRGQLEARLAALDRTLAEEASQPASTQSATAPVKEPAAVTAGTAGATGAPPMAAESEARSAPASALQPSNAAQNSPDRTVPIVLMASGGALVVGSIVTGVMTLGKRSELADAETQCKKLGTCNALSQARVNELNDTRSSGKTLAIVTDVLLFGGLAVAATGFVLFLVKSGSEERASASASLSCAPGACAGRFQLHF